MSPRSRTQKSCKFLTHRSLLITRESPLPRPPGCLGGCSASCPESSSEDYPTGYPERNPKSYRDVCSVSYSESYLERNSPNCSANCRVRCSAGCSANCPENRSAGSSGSNLPGNSRESWRNCSESCRESLLLGAFPSSTSLDEDDLANNSRLVAGGLWPLPGLCLSLRLGGETERSPAAANRPGSPPPPRGAGLHPPCPTT